MLVDFRLYNYPLKVKISYTSFTGTITYTISSGNGMGKFAIDRTLGVIRVAGALDYESIQSYTLTVLATDKGTSALSSSATVSIAVLDVNDIAPVCTASLYTGSVAEDASNGTEVATVICSDADSTSTYNEVKYSITSGQAQPKFAVDQNNGKVTVNQALDIESADSYSLTIRATDGTFNTDVTLTITLTNVNDFTPIFSPAGPYITTITENLAVGSTIFDVNATDGDYGSTTFIYSIISGNGDGKFTIGVSSGIIQTQKAIDRDNPLTVSYTLGITVADGTGTGALTSTTSIVIHVDDENDNYPVCDARTYTATVLEDQTQTSVITPVCTDLDVVASPTLAYTLTGSGNSNFLLLSDGSLSVSTKLDYETTTMYNLTVTVSDHGNPVRTIQLTMLIFVDPVNENAPVFQDLPYDRNITEDKTLGSTVVTISATDSDKGSTHGDVRYAIKSGNNEGKFALNPSTGKLVVSGSLDRETTDEYLLTMTASDMLEGDVNAKTTEIAFKISISDVNDNYPVLNHDVSYVWQVNENVGIGSVVGTVTATDDDVGLAGTSGLKFTITNGSNGDFAMNGNKVVVNDDLDAAIKSVYILTIRVEDQGSPVRSTSTIVSIQVKATNDHAPGFDLNIMTNTLQISEDEPVGNSIFTVPGHDNDTGNFGDIRFYIRGGNTDSAFMMELVSGAVRVANILDYDTPPTVYSLTIEVEDSPLSPTSRRTSTYSLTVSLVDANDETPIFSKNLYSQSLDENTGAGFSVVSLTATDKDTNANGVIKFSLISGTGMAKFEIDEDTGEITTSVNIDYEDMVTYYLLVQAVDQGTDPLSSTCLVLITVNDINDNSPVFPFDNVAVSIAENASVGAPVATARATDADSNSNNNNVIDYSFQNDNSQFQINPASGEITIENKLDRETTTR